MEEITVGNFFVVVLNADFLSSLGAFFALIPFIARQSRTTKTIVKVGPRGEGKYCDEGPRFRERKLNRSETFHI